MENQKSSFFWNILQSMAYSVQTVFFLLIVTRVTDLFVAGVFSVTYSVGQMFASVGNFSMRSYQVSDAEKTYSFNTYLGSRVISVLAMFLLCGIYSFVHGYSCEKLILIGLFCFYRTIEAIEDVYHAEIQRQGYLNIAARNAFIRIAGCSLVFIIVFVISKNLMLSTVAFTLSSMLLFIALNIKTINKFELLVKPSFENIIKLFVACFPICVGTFLYNYLANSPKYAIDSVLTDDVQTIFNIIYLPVFVISLMGTFIYNPCISSMGIMWNSKKYKEFTGLLKKQIMMLCIMAISVIIGGYFLGIPVLSIVYGVKLDDYKLVFMLLLVFGIIVAVDSLCNIILTVMRKQHIIMISYTIACVFNLIIMKPMTSRYHLLGVSLAYGISMSIIFVIMMTSIFCFLFKSNND